MVVLSVSNDASWYDVKFCLQIKLKPHSISVDEDLNDAARQVEVKILHYLSLFLSLSHEL